MGWKSSSAAVRNVNQAAGSQAMATSSQPVSRRHAARAEPHKPSSPRTGVATMKTADGQNTSPSSRARSGPDEASAICASIACSRSMWWMGASGSPVQRAFTQSQNKAGAAATAQYPNARGTSRVRTSSRAPRSGRYIHPS